ncbi:MAG: hypothetical protein QM610_03375 [Chitinophagaceae bacterium]
MFNIIYQTTKGPQTDFENQYWNDWLLENIAKDVYYDNGSCQTILPNSVVVYSTNHYRLKQPLLDYIGSLDNPVLVHLSNEGQNHHAQYYKKARAVFRTASWNPASAYANVFTLPLGFQSGYMNDRMGDVALYKRDFAWVFAGAIKQNRQVMLSALESIHPHWYFKSTDWGSADAKTTEELVAYYKNAVFAPSPFGNINHECFRTMEALEWGCIPVTTYFLGEDCYRYIYGDHPFLVGKDWKDAADQMKQLLADRDTLQKKQKEVWDWYQNFKKELQADIAHVLDGDFDKVTGRQFRYQRQSRNEWKLRWRFFRHFTLDVYWKRILGKVIKSKEV